MIARKIHTFRTETYWCYKHKQSVLLFRLYFELKIRSAYVLFRDPLLLLASPYRKSVGSQTWDNRLGQEAVTIINTFCVLQNESCFSKGNRDLVTMNRQWWFSNYIFSRTLDNLHWTIRMHLYWSHGNIQGYLFSHDQKWKRYSEPEV